MNNNFSKGLNRIIMINNNSHYYSEFSLDGVTQITGSNNVGKTTLLNALRFLYIDKMERMGFKELGYNKDQTINHYFPNENSFLLFELNTVDEGVVVIGFRGTIFSTNGEKFERFVYRERYIEEDFVTYNDHSNIPVIKSSNDIRAKLQSYNDFQIVSGKDKSYYHLISGKNDLYPTLQLVPKESANGNKYRQFLHIFKKILETSKSTTQDELKKMFIAVTSASTEMFSDNNEHKNIDAILREFLLIKNDNDVIDTKKRFLKDLQIIDSDGNKLIATITEVMEYNKELHTNFIRIRKLIADHILSLKSEEDTKKVFLNNLNGEISAKESELRKLVSLEGNLKAKKEIFDQEKEWVEQNIPFGIEMVLSRIKDIDNKYRKLMNKIDEAETGNIEKLFKEKNKLESFIKREEERLNNFEKLILNVVANKYSNKEANLIFCVLNKKFSEIDINQIYSEEKFIEWIDDIYSSINTDNNTFYGKGVTLLLDSQDGLCDDLFDKDKIKNDIEESRKMLVHVNDKISSVNNMQKIKYEAESLKKELDIELNKKLKFEDYEIKIKSYPDIENNLSETVISIKKIENDLSDFKKSKSQYENTLSEVKSRISKFDFNKSKFDKALNEISNKDNILSKYDYFINDKEFTEILYQYDQGSYTALLKRNELIKICISLREKVDFSIGKISDDIPNINHKENYTDNAITAKDEILSIQEEEKEVKTKHEQFRRDFNLYLERLMQDAAAIENVVRKINRTLSDYKISNLKEVYISFEVTDTYKKIKAISSTTSDDLFNVGNPTCDDIHTFEGFLNSLGNKIKIDVIELFTLNVNIVDSDGEPNSNESIDKVHSGGTTVSLKVLLHVILLREIFNSRSKKQQQSDIEQHFKMPFFIDEILQLDPHNMDNIFDLSRKIGMIPITASPAPAISNKNDIKCYFAMPFKAKKSGSNEPVERIIVNKATAIDFECL